MEACGCIAKWTSDWDHYQKSEGMFRRMIKDVMQNEGTTSLNVYMFKRKVCDTQNKNPIEM